MVAPSPEYDAFISYARDDREIAQRLQRRLEALRPPASAATSSQLRVFLDSEDLSASNSLSDSLREALAASRFLIVIASPLAIQSTWVHEEIRMWRADKAPNTLLFLLAAGDPNALLVELAGVESASEVPLAADIRADSTKSSLKRLEDEYLRLAAPLLGVSFDDLRQRALRARLRRQRQLVAALTGVLVVVCSAGAVAIWQWRVAVGERIAAEHRLQEAITVSETVLNDLDTSLRGVSGAETLRLSLVKTASDMLDQLEPQRKDRSALVEARLRAHLRRGRVATDQGDETIAWRELNAARKLLPNIGTPGARARASVQVYALEGRLALARGKYSDAESQFDLAIEHCRTWEASLPGRDAMSQHVSLLRLRGDAKAHRLHWAAARADYNAARLLLDAIMEKSPNLVDASLEAATVHERLSRVAEVERDAHTVVSEMKTAIELVERVEPESLSQEGLIQLIELYGRLAELCEQWEQKKLAVAFDNKAQRMVFGLYMTSPQNSRYRKALGEAWGRLGERAREQGNLDRAKTLFALRTYMFEYLADQASSNLTIMADHIEARAALLAVLVEAGDRTSADEQFQELKAAVSSMERVRDEVVGDERSSLLITAYNQLGEAARLVRLSEERAQAYAAALALAQDRYAKSPDDQSAQLDLLFAHANMILAAAGKNDVEAMKTHAEAAHELLPTRIQATQVNRESLDSIANLIEEVLGGT